MENQERSKINGGGDIFDNMGALESDDEQDEFNVYINKKKLEYIIKNQDVNQLPKFIKRAIDNTDTDSDSDTSSNISKNEISKPYNSLQREEDEEEESPSKSNIFFIPDDPCENQLEVSNQIKEFNKLSEEYSKLEIGCSNNNNFLNISNIREDETIEGDNNFNYSSIGSERISQSFQGINDCTSEKDQIEEMNKLTFKSEDISSLEILNSKSDNNISISEDSNGYKEFLDIIYNKDDSGINNINRDNIQIQDKSINSNSTFQTNYNLFSNDNSQTQDSTNDNSIESAANNNIFSNDNSQSQDRSYDNSIELAANYNIFSNDDSGQGSIGSDNQFSFKTESSFMDNSKTSGDYNGSGSFTEFKFSPNKNSKPKYTTISKGKSKSPYHETNHSTSNINKYNRTQIRSPDNRTNIQVNEFVFGNNTSSSINDFEDSNKVNEFVYDPSNNSKTRINTASKNYNNKNNNKNDNIKFKSNSMGGSKFGKHKQRKYINKNDPNINEIGEGSKLTFEDE